jgi:hypothetical protein
MAISMKDLFTREAIRTEDDYISFRRALANHAQGMGLGLAGAAERFLQNASSDGLSRGCRRPEEATATVVIPFLRRVTREVGGAIPQWVSAADVETRTIEGILTRSRISDEDVPMQPWHRDYDWIMYVRLDKQYKYLVSPANREDDDDPTNVVKLECEWDSAFLPAWAWPSFGSRVWVVGRWVYDCGHPEAGHRTEIHPPKALVSFRSESAEFSDNPGPSRANSAVVFIGRQGDM